MVPGAWSVRETAMSLRKFTYLLPLAIIALLLTLPSVIAETSPPGALQAEVGRDYVDLGWQPVPGAESYNVYRGSPSGMTLLANVSAPFTSYHDGGLEDGLTFTYHITAVEGGNESAPSNSLTVTVPAKESVDALLPILAIVLSVIAIQICVIMLMVMFRKNFSLK